MKQLVPGTVVTTSIFKSELGLGFSVCKRIVNALPCGGACTAMSPNHSGESTPRPTTIYVKDIASRSPAWNDGTLEPGDQILKINRFDVSSVGYKEALRLLRSTVGEVEITVLKQPLKIADRPNLLSLSGDQIHFSPADPSENNFESMPDAPPPWYVGNVEYDPRSIELRDGQKTWIWLEKSEAAANSGIGLSIAALARRGALQDQLSLTDSIVITAIQPNSVSALDGRLRLGDRILQIDECELSGIPAESAIRILKEKSRNSKEVYLYVERYARHSVVHADNSTHCRFATEIFEVEIWKPQNGGIGILISGTGENGILVTGIVPRSVAESNGLICVGDVMLELNGIDVTRFRQEEVATLLKNAQGLLTFKFKRTVTIAQSSLRSHSGSVASIAASTKALRETEPSTATNTHSSIAVSPQCSSDELHVDVHRPVNFANMHKSPSSGSFYKHVYAKRKQKAMQKRARSASPKRTHPFGHFPRDRKRSEDEACESESTCLWQTILTPLNRIKYSIFPSFTAKSTDDTSLSNNADEDRCIENEYSLSDVFVMRDRNGQLGFGVTGGKMDDSSYWLEELAVLHLNKMASLPVVVTRIVKEGPADRSRQIEVGDRIVLINNQSVDGLAHEQVVQRLRGPPQTPIHFRLERAHEKSRLMRLWPNKSKKSQPRRPGVCKVTFERTMSKGLGFCIMGGYDEISGRFVPFVIKAVFPQSPAAKYGLRPGDQLLSVNGSSLENELHETAVTLLKNPKDGKTTLLLLTV